MINNEKTVLIVYNENYPWDVRIWKFSKSLIQAGYRVVVLCNNKDFNKKTDNYDGAIIERVSSGYNKIAQIPIFLNPFWIARIQCVVRKYSVNLIIVRDLPIALAGILVSKLNRIPVLYDMAENYPEAIKIWKSTGDYEKKIDRIFRNYKFFKIIEKVTCKVSGGILVVVRESRDRLIGDGVDSGKISIIENTPILNTFAKNNELKNRSNIICYVGGFQYHRGIVDMILAMNIVVKNCSEIKLNIVGDGRQRFDYESLVSRYGLENNIKFVGYLKNDEIYDYIRNSFAGIIPHMKSGHTDTTMPNKIYDYMSQGKAVIVSNAKPLKRLVEEKNLGVCFLSGDFRDLAKQILHLYHENDLTEKMGSNGREAVLGEYNWGVDGVRLVGVVDAMFEEHKFGRDK